MERRSSFLSRKAGRTGVQSAQPDNCTGPSNAYRAGALEARACPQRSEDSRSPQDEQSARLAASAEVGQVESTHDFTDQQLCDWYEAQPETYLNYLYENFGANTPREAWGAHMHGKRTLRCACCDSTNLEQFCYQAPHPIFCCCNCGTQLNLDGSVCVEPVDQVEQFQRWLETKAHKSSAVIQATEPRLCFARDVYLDESLVIAECRVATKLLMQFKQEQSA